MSLAACFYPVDIMDPNQIAEIVGGTLIQSDAIPADILSIVRRAGEYLAEKYKHGDITVYVILDATLERQRLIGTHRLHSPDKSWDINIIVGLNKTYLDTEHGKDNIADTIVHEIAHALDLIKRLNKCKTQVEFEKEIIKSGYSEHSDGWGICYAEIYRAVMGDRKIGDPVTRAKT